MNFINGIYQLYRWKQESVIFYFNKKDLIIRCYQKEIWKYINLLILILSQKRVKN